MSSEVHMKYFASLFLLSLIISFHCKGALTGNFEVHEPKTATLLETKSVSYFIDIVSYVNGGITFNFPEGLFSGPPIIKVSLQISYSASQAYVIQITENNATSATVRVNLLTTSTITEASNDEVIVHIFTLGK